ncbi:tyrosine-type recombinase/integrase [Pantoea sp. JKS000250]|uniref:tyrosine-type recombinase/integrase n=1 Tax=Pantoea sp. JKS000250 TaxID=1938795 RepID=UPI000D7595A8|nr:tyrosine-type recombinase/integrase [Pantoea sp. JKS000250]PXW15087.1 phage integrase family protein [Pantoea sp. JKS000250]
MSEIVPLTRLTVIRNSDITERLRQFVQDKEAFSPNTWRQLLSVMRICNQWSEDNQRTFLPMSAEDLRDYLSFLAESGRASSTVTSHAALISMLHRNAGLPVPNGSPLVFRTMKKINRVAVVNGERAGQAVPFRLTDLMVLDKQWSGSGNLQVLRDLAFLHVAYATLLRISELSRLRVRDVMRAGDGRIILDVAWTKTIVQTGGLIKALSAHSTRRLEEWIEASGLSGQPDAWLFNAVHRSGRVLITEKPMSTRALEQIFNRAWRTAGKGSAVKANKNRYTGWSGHSARVGAAQDMADKGYPVARIMQEGTWKKPETLMRYIRHVDAHKGAMVEFMEQYAEPDIPG